jgi:hypothetical protein
MKWHRIAIRSHDAEIAQASATAFVERVLKACSGTTLPKDFEVWHRRYTPMDHEYFLSPVASEILLPVLAGYRPAPCDAPDLRTLRQLLI